MSRLLRFDLGAIDSADLAIYGSDRDGNVECIADAEAELKETVAAFEYVVALAN